MANEGNFLQGMMWAIVPEMLETIAAVVEQHAAGQAAAYDGPTKSGPKADTPYDVTADGVAIIPIYGVTGRRANLLERMSGATSTQIVGELVRAASQDASVRAILLDIDSPGGTVNGTMELANAVRAAREVKPIVAYTGGAMCSAAYWIASAATRVMAIGTASVGSIGIASVHYDLSKRDAQAGVQRTMVYAGKYKRIASDNAPLSDEARTYLQDQIDALYDQFVSTVAQNRGVEERQVRTRMAEGKVFIGEQAMDAGLVDQVGDMDDAMALAISLTSNEENPMDPKNKQGFAPAQGQTKPAQMSAEQLRQDYSAAVAEIEQQARDAGSAETVALVGAVLGSEAEAKIKNVASAGVSAEQVQALSGVLGAAKGAPSGAQPSATEQALAALEQSGAQALKAGQPAEQDPQAERAARLKRLAQAPRR